MSRLHPTARALIATAKRQEGELPRDAHERVHASVLRRAALGAVATGAAATSAATAAAKTGVAALVASHPFVAGGLALVLASGSGLAIGKVWRATLDSGRVTDAHSAEPPERSAPLHVPMATTLRVPPIAPAIERAATVTIPPNAPAPAAMVTATMTTRAPGAPAVSQAPLLRAASPQLAVQANEPPYTQVVSSLATSAAVPPIPTVAVNPAPSAFAFNDSPAGAPDLLSVQLPILRRVRTELGEHHPAQVLSLLDQYASVLRSGPLVEEAELARVSALCQVGNTADARAAIERFVAKWPGSPMAVVLQNGCPSEDLPTGAGANRHGSR
jgi:hypothetical protein